jgi:hypothetical protein
MVSSPQVLAVVAGYQDLDAVDELPARLGIGAEDKKRG